MGGVGPCQGPVNSFLPDCPWALPTARLLAPFQGAAFSLAGEPSVKSDPVLLRKADVVDLVCDAPHGLAPQLAGSQEPAVRKTLTVMTGKAAALAIPNVERLSLLLRHSSL